MNGSCRAWSLLRRGSVLAAVLAAGLTIGGSETRAQVAATPAPRLMTTSVRGPIAVGGGVPSARAAGRKMTYARDH
jgi:hypothetical protein